MSISKPESMIDVRDLTVRYGDAVAATAIQLQIETGQFAAVLGANGAGKSSIGKALAGLIPSSGEIIFAGIDISSLGAEERVRHGIVYVPEGRRVFSQATVEDNLRAGGFTCRRSYSWRQRLAEIYDRIPRLAERSNIKAELLSGGEQQLLAIGRGLMARPKLIILDEPSLGLAPGSIDMILNFLTKISADENLSVLILEQNISFASRIAQRAWVLRLGQISPPVDAATISKPEALLEMLVHVESGAIDDREKGESP